jgi:hypothetical protein
VADIVTTALYKLQVDGVEQVKQADAALAKLADTEDKAAASAAKVTAANDEMAASVAEVTVVETRGAAAKQTSTAQLDRWLASMDRATRINQQYQAGLARVAAFERDQVGTAEDRARALALVNARYDSQIAALDKVGRATNDNVKTGAQQTAGLNASTHAVNDNAKAHEGLSVQGQSAFHSIRSMAEQLALGAPPTQALTAQLNHLSFAASGPGGLKGAFGEAIGMLGNFITPTTAAIAGVVALGAAIAYLAAHAAADNQRLKDYNITLKTMGDTGEITAEKLNVATKALINQGEEADKAQAAIKALITIPGLDKGSVPFLAQLAENITANRGGDIVSWAEKLGKAASGTADELEKLNETLGVKYTDAERAAINASKMARDENAQRIIELQALANKFAGVAAAMKTPWQEALAELRTTWNKFLDEFGPPALAIVTDFFKEFNILIKNTAHELQLLKDLWEWGKAHLPQWSGDDPTGARAAAAAQAAGAPGGTNLGPPTATGAGADSIRTGIQFFLDKGLALEHATGIVAALAVESGGGSSLDPTAVNPKSGAYGIAQALGSRQPAYKAAGDNLLGQLEVVWSEFTGKEFEAFKTILATTTAKEAAIAMDNFERAQNPASTAKAGAVAEQLASGLASGLTSKPGTPAYLPDVSTTAPRTKQDTSEAQANIVAKQRSDLALYNQELGKQGRALAEVQARTEATLAAESKGLEGDYKKDYITNAVTAKLKAYDAQLALTAANEDKQTQGILATTEGFLKGEIPGLQAAAQAQAEYAVMTGTAANVEQKKAAILKASAAEALAAGAKALPALELQLGASTRLADATAKGTAAEHEAVLENQVATATHDALAKAIATGNPALIKQAEAITTVTGALIKKNDVQQQTYQLEQQNNQRTNQIQVLELEAKLQGQTSEEIQHQVLLLQTKQDLQARGLTTSDAIYNTTLKSVEAYSQANIQLAEASRAQQGINDAIKSVADTAVTTLGTAFGDIFSGKKVTDWGATVKSTIASILQNLVTGSIIKPIIGTVLTGLGFGAVGSQYGSIGGTLSAIGNIGGGGASGTSSTSGLNTGTLLQGGGLLKDIFGGSGSGGGLFSKAGDFLNNTIGTNLGFQASGPLAQYGGLSATELSDLGLSAPAGSVFGSTFGSFLGGAGLGFGAGSLLNTVLGGNKTGGTIGSAGGALAGAALGSFFPVVGTIAGGLIGGLAGGGLGGLFGGGTKKPDQASGGVINLATGQIMNAQSGGNAQNDATASQIGQTLAAAVTRALAIPGAVLPGGAVSVQAGSRDGIKLSYQGQEYKFADASSAIAAGLIALRDNLTGVSETVQKVLHNISDPNQINAALDFAAAYDKLQTAADSAFSTVEQGTVAIGPFETAMNQITTLFDGLTTQTEQFGLSLDPVNAALAEATKRLNDDFAKAVDKAFNTATGKDFLNNIQDILDNYQTMARDASAIGASRAVQDKLGGTVDAQLQNVLTQLTGPQLDEVIASFGTLAFTDLPALAKAAKDAADATAALTLETNRQAAAYQIQQDYDTAAGQGFLSQLRDLDKARQAAQANAKALNLGDDRQGVIAETEHRAALTILQGLNNDQLELARKTLAELNPAFAAWVDEAAGMVQTTKDAAAATQAQADAQQRSNAILAAGLQIRQYLNAQEASGADYTSPQSRLEASRAQFQTQLGLAQGGDVNALQGITAIADELRQALVGWFASSAPGAAEWEQAKAALAALPGVPNAQQTSTNAIVEAITTGATATVNGVSDATSASAQQIIGTTIATNAAIVDNARSTARDIVTETGASSTRIVNAAIDSTNGIVQNGIESSARIVGATTTGLNLATGATLTTGAQIAAAANNTASAVDYSTAATKSGTMALLASNEDNARTLIAGSKEDTSNLLAQQEANAGALLSANAQQAAALTAQNELNAAAVVNTTNTTAASIVAQSNASARQIIDTATATSDAARASANDNTAQLAWTANATSAEVASRNDKAVATLTATTAAGTTTLLAQGKDVAMSQAAIAQATTDTTVAAAYDSTALLGSRTEAASANVAATTQAGTNALIAKGDAQIAALQSLAGITVGDVQVATAIYNSAGWIVGDNAAWSNAIYQQIAAYSTWVVQSNADWTLALINTVAAWGNAINYTTWAMLDATIRTIRDWSNLINYTTWAGLDTNWRVTEAWGNAIVGTVAAWGNATCGTIGAWGNAEVGNANNNAVNIINMIAGATNSVTNSIFAAANTMIAATYGANGLNMAATITSGEGVIGAIGSMSVSNIAATYTAANTIVAQVAATGNSGQVAGEVSWLRSDNNWWLSAINGSINNLTGNEVAWNQNLYNIVNATRDTLNYWFSRCFDELFQIHEYIHLLTEVTIQFDIWMSAHTDAQHDALVSIETDLRRQAFG